MDGPLAANSGHQGTAMALAPLAHVLYSRVMRYDPADPNWVDRDRFILSAGHASILQYAMLHLSGTSLSADDLRAFRQWGQRRPVILRLVIPLVLKSRRDRSAKALRMGSVWRFLNVFFVSSLALMRLTITRG